MPTRILIVEDDPDIAQLVARYLEKAGFLPEVVSSGRDARIWRKSSIFLRRIVGSMFMRVNAKCAHQVRPPLAILSLVHG